ncbi:MAG: carboxyl transferase [Lachnospiraceae bacterium]|nr:carboxyl transferase [Lachnospiraceae bacterium]
MSNYPSSSAGRRIASLLDENSFVEIGGEVTARITDFNEGSAETPSDGVITGYGVIDGKAVYIYSQDASVLNGSIGEMHAKKISHIYKLAMKVGAPVIGLIDSSGVRIREAMDSLMSMGSIHRNMALASGVIPQVTAVFGECGGGMAITCGLSDFVFMEENGKLYVNSPNAIPGNNEAKKDTASCEFKAKESDMVDGSGDEASIIAKMRALVSMLPSNNADIADANCTDDLNRIIPDIKNMAEDTSIMLYNLADKGSYLELKDKYARDMVTALIKLDGITVGAIANRSVVYNSEGKKEDTFDSSLTLKGVRKATDFVRFCDSFDIPILTITNVNGFCACECSEKQMAKAAASLEYAFAEATVPKVNVITEKAWGSAFVAMNSKALGADITFAWEGAKIGVMDSNLAAKIMYEGQGADVISQKAKEYEELSGSALSAAKRGYVDSVIAPMETRKYVIGAFEMLYTKGESHPDKKHGTK